MSTKPPADDARPTPHTKAPLLRSAVLSLHGVVHGFTSREGGVSTGPLASLNLAPRPGESVDTLHENWCRVTRALRPDLAPEAVAVMHQVHGDRVVRVVGARGPFDPAGEADGAVTTELGVVLAVRTADCVPVLLAAPGGVAVAHAGWRGVVAGVVPAVVAALCDAAGAGPAQVAAAIGPHISGEAYEVGEEVVVGMRATGLPDAVFLLPRPGRRDHVDLGAAVWAQLERAGVLHIERVPGCTASDPRFYSHRRDGPETGRMAGVVARLP
ncbi:MAG: peptidoglycan editing factor PgeF [Deltaproteobacteria bacterium]|nr:peptidoglycan editing factor PgeF [Deltaproteobacteria bacterium]